MHVDKDISDIQGALGDRRSLLRPVASAVSQRPRALVWLACVSAMIGCTAGASVTPAPPSGCGQDSSVSCSQGVGWSCPAGENPEQSNLSCSIPTPNGSDDDFCCFDWTYGTTCAPDDGLTSVCQPDSFGYRCQAGDNPNSLDSTLNCSSPTPDGSDDDFCCN
jgi:hypothetical protein